VQQPNGAHCEKPLEIGLRHDSAIISISVLPKKNQRAKQTEAGGSDNTPLASAMTELENVEALFTDQGLYVYKSYASPSNFDTSMVHCVLFKVCHAMPCHHSLGVQSNQCRKLMRGFAYHALQELITRHYVPSVIVKHQFPTSQAYNVLTNFLEPEVTSSMLTFASPYFAGGIPSYYDHSAVRERLHYCHIHYYCRFEPTNQRTNERNRPKPYQETLSSTMAMRTSFN